MNQTNSLLDTGRNSSFKIGDKTNDPYISPTPRHFPIVAWSPVPRDFQILLDCDDTDLCQNPPGYNGSEEYNALLREIALSLKESGFNAIVMMGSYKGCEGMMEAALDTPDKNGKDCDISSIFVTLPRYRNSFAAMDAMIEHFSDKKTKKGKPYPSAFLIQDEPRFNDWSQSVFGLQYKNTKEHVADYEWNTFTVPCIYFKQWRDRWMFFPNLGGSGDEYKNGTWHVDPIESEYRSQFSGNATNQEQYLQALQLLFHPGLWSYDQYPFVIVYNKEEESENPELTFDDTTVAENITDPQNLKYLTKKTQEFYHFLECFNKLSKDTNRPFWSFLYTCASGGWISALQRYDSFFPTPTIGMLRFEAFNALALGAQGLVCFQYGMGLSKQFLSPDEDTAVFVDAPMQATVPINPVPGETTVTLKYRDNQLWQDVKTVMNEVRSLEKVFLNTNVIAFGHYFWGDVVLGDYEGLQIVSFASGTPAGFFPIRHVNLFDAKSPGVLISILETTTDTEELIEPIENTSSLSDDMASLRGIPPVSSPITPSPLVTNHYIVITNHDALNSQRRIQITFASGYRIETIFGSDIPAIDVPPCNTKRPYKDFRQYYITV